MKNPEVTKQIPELYQFVAAAEKLTPVEVTWGPEFFEGVSAAGAKLLIHVAGRPRVVPTIPLSQQGTGDSERDWVYGQQSANP